MDDEHILTIEDEVDLAFHDLASQADHLLALLTKLQQRGAP